MDQSKVALKGHTGNVYTIFELPNNQLISSSDDEIIVWDLLKQSVFKKIPMTGNNTVTRVKKFFINSNGHLVGCGTQSYVLIFDLKSDFKIIYTLEFENQMFKGYSQFNGLVGLAYSDEIKIYNQKYEEVFKKSFGKNSGNAFSGMIYLERGYIVAAVFHGDRQPSHVYMYDSKNKFLETQSNSVHGTQIEYLHPATGDFFATASGLDELFIWDCKDIKNPLKKIQCQPTPRFLTLYGGQLMVITDAQYSKKNTPGSVKDTGGLYYSPAKTFLFNPQKNFECSFEIATDVNDSGLNSETVLKDGRVVIGKYKGTIRIFNLKTGKIDQTIQSCSDRVSILFEGSNGKLYSGYWDNTSDIYVHSIVKV